MNSRDGVLAGSSRTEPEPGRSGREPSRGAGLRALWERVISPLVAMPGEHGFGFDRRWLTAWFAAFAVYAALMTAFGIGGEDGVWGIWATCGYTLAAILAYRSRGLAVPLLVAFGFAMVGPTLWLAVRDPATADVIVVSRSAVLLLHHGSPYLPVSQLANWTSYNPYLPAMALFGLPSAAGFPGLLGDPRPWLTAATVVLAAAAFWVGTPHRGSRCRDCRGAAWWFAVFAVASPLLALPLSVGITDPPVTALTCLALAFVARSRRMPVAAGLTIGVACAMKATAWPALAVIAALLVARDGPRTAARFVVAAAVTGAGLVAATAPALLTKPSALLQNTVLFPLGLTQHKTPAASPLPGHVLASFGHAGHTAAVGLLAAAGLAVAVSLVIRPPADVPAAARRLAIGLGLMFALAPAARFGYFAYPLALLAWSALTGADRAPARDQRAEPATSRAQPAPSRAEPAPSAPVPGEQPAPAAKPTAT
ncbi:MAG TPA: glycosyltransferase 87 family protein [Streptosporangiaceae bacterium]|nr:glycosyltransferase 87 family protein [Streptosporangiaceae bacterium]